MGAQSVGWAWAREAGLLIAWVAVATGTGVVTGVPLAALCIALAVFLFLYVVHGYRLHRWLASGGGDPPEGVAVWREIFTALYRIRQRNRKRTRYLKGIVAEFEASAEALPNGVVVVDANGCIVWFNQAAVMLLGLRPRQDRGQRILNLLRHPCFASYWAAEDHEQREVEIPSPMGDSGVLCLRVICYGDGQRLLVARDVSKQKRMEATRRDFVTNASHELRTALTDLHGYVHMMQEKAASGGSLVGPDAPIQQMETRIRSMTRLIDNSLKLASVEDAAVAQQQELIDAPTLIEALLTASAENNARTANIKAHVNSGLFFYGHADELESLFSNLIQNAVEYTPADGEIRVRWDLEADHVIFSVIDCGVGIEVSHIPYLTQPFYRLDKSRSKGAAGMGLGLSIVQHCLQNHGGNLEISSEPDVGSVFTCRFPRQRGHLRHAA